MPQKVSITYEVSGGLDTQLQLWACARTLSLRYGWEFLYRPIIHDARFRLREAYRAGMIRRSLAIAKAAARHRIVRLNDHSWDTSFNLNGTMSARYLEMEDTLFVLEWGGIFKQIHEFREVLLAELLGETGRVSARRAERWQVGIHVRCAQAQHTMPLRYYSQAVEQARTHCDGDPVLHIFGDGDVAPVCQELQGACAGCTVVPHWGTPVSDLLSMARFRTLILSCSWFSYWAAFLSQATRIYAPKNFCYCRQWIPVDCDPVMAS